MKEHENIGSMAAQSANNQVQASDSVVPQLLKKKSAKTRISKKKAALMIAKTNCQVSCSSQVSRADPELEAFKLIYRKALATQSNQQLYGREHLPRNNNQYMETLAAERSIKDLRGMYNLAFVEGTLSGSTSITPNSTKDYVCSTCVPYFYNFIEAYLKSRKPT